MIDIYKQAAELIQGNYIHTLEGSPRHVLEIITGYSPRYEEVDNFRQYLDSIDTYACNNCGRWTIPNEGKGLYCASCDLETVIFED
jgi:hypothetical protein